MKILLFHHAQGLTDGVRAIADRLRAAGHDTTTPDLYDGATYEVLADGIAHGERLGVEGVLERGRRAAESLPGEIVYAGLSLGVLPAQTLAQTRPGARGAIFLHSCVPASFIGPWPAGVPAQIHAMEADPIFAREGDLEAARALAGAWPGVELFLYPGDGHLFTDRSLPDWDEAAAALVFERMLEFLDRLKG